MTEKEEYAMVGEVAQEAGRSPESEAAEPAEAAEAVAPDPTRHEEPPEARVCEGDEHDGSEDGEAQEARELQHLRKRCVMLTTGATGCRAHGVAIA